MVGTENRQAFMHSKLMEQASGSSVGGLFFAVCGIFSYPFV